MLTIDTTEKDWARGVDAAETKVDLLALCEEWHPYASDAKGVVLSMTPNEWTLWRAGLALERSRVFAGQEFAERFGAILLPEKLMDATLVARRFHVPLVIALQRIEEKEDGRT